MGNQTRKAAYKSLLRWRFFVEFLDQRSTQGKLTITREGANACHRADFSMTEVKFPQLSNVDECA